MPVMELPELSFFLFGMGRRRKLLYASGRLRDARTGEVIRAWDVAQERIAAADYAVFLETSDRQRVVIREDAEGARLEEGMRRAQLARGPLRLPTFDGHPHAAMLRTLHHEILFSLTADGPVPNLFVYHRPWYRDAAMTCMVLERTGNLHLVEPWIARLREPFDRNNAGRREPDNLGQLLYMISLVSDASHPLVEVILGAAGEFRRGRHIVGETDFAEHPVYQTKWLKFGLRRLGLDDPYEVPDVADAYSALFWMDFKSSGVAPAPFATDAKARYPYLAWAEAHFHGWPPPMRYCAPSYPLTWEAEASQADYEGMAVVSRRYVERRLCAPHAWHAAEMFLYLSELDRDG
jgi:hypothetical protein